MATHARFLPLAAAALLLSGCGYTGDPLPPSLSIPGRIADLHAFERGDKIVVDFTAPLLATDETPLRRLRDVELRVGPEGADWAGRSQRVETGATEGGPAHVEFAAGPWVGQSVMLSVRAVSRKGRVGAWSNEVRLKVVAPLETPANVKAEGTASGVAVRWTAAARPDMAWRVFRNGDLAGAADKTAYVDAAAQYGAKYEYTVQAAMKAGDAEAESLRSQAATVAYEDVFAPDTPAGLSALTGLDSVQLTWNPNAEADLHGYYLYRASGDGAFARVGALLDAPTYTDRAIQAGQRYRYAVSAIDQKGNESARSAVVEAVAP